MSTSLNIPVIFFFFKQKTAYEIGLGIPAEPLFRSRNNIMVTLHEVITFLVSMQISISSLQTHNVNRCGRSRHLARKLRDRKSGSAGMPRPISYAVFCLKKKIVPQSLPELGRAEVVA